MALLQPALPSRFKALRRIGEGGMGVVYEALDVERGVRVALKTVIHHDADALARFKQEFRSLQNIHHENLVGLGELVGDAEEVFFTMELIEGVDLLTYVRGDARRVDASGSQTVVDARRGGDMTLVDPPGASAAAEEDDTPTDSPLLILAEGGFDEARLRDAFRQIALGLSALHEANKVHRDIKPSNVRVTPEGRVVLLDFGLVLETNDPRAAELSMEGTPAYMAPEQVASTGVGPEADWYSMGVMMYQCLTGRRPFEGSTMDILAAKLVHAPLPPSAFARNVPRDLDGLCAQLLSVEKHDRPTASDVLRRLDVDASQASGATSLSQSGSNPFVGRARELVELAHGFADVAAGRAVTIALQGESGVGKSCLVKRFVDEVLPAQQGDAEVLVLAGRCYEREAVPYKAFDEVIDALSRRLARLSNNELAPLLPDHVEDLAVLFPALLRAPLIAQQGRGPALDPHERRRHAFDALRDLFGRLARGHRLVLSIDDLQWSDADSLQLLGDLLRPPDAPPMLLIATVRSDPEAPAAPARVLASLPGDVRVVAIDRLAADDARELAVRLLKRVAPGAADAGAIALEAGGHPLFIDELVRHVALTSGKSPGAALRLDDALAARVARLDAAARRVLEIACVIGAPVSQETVAQAAALEMREFVRAVALLRTSNLVRTSGARVSDAMQPYHDRVREALVARMEPATARECHQRIASALEVSKAFDPEVLATHWAGAGQPAKAAKYAVVAAEQAASALAFDRAARLYDQALDLLPEGDPRRSALRRQLGDALASAGKGARAAAEYERAATAANAADALDLRRRAANQLLRGGEMQRGIEATSAVLAAVGMSLPVSTLGALLALLWFRAVLWVRGLDFTPRDDSQIAPSDLMRLDACASVADTLPYADALRGAVFHTRHLLLALRFGESRRIARALAAESAYLATQGSRTWPRTQRIIARAYAVAERAGTPEARASVLAFAGPAQCLNLRYTAGVQQIEAAIAILREHVPGSVWEVTTLRFFLFIAYSYLGRFVEQRAQQEAALKDALERGDKYAAVMFRIGVLNRIWWMGGDPARARRELDDAVRDWPAGSGAFDMIHFHQLIGYGYLDLYEGNPAAAYARVKRTWPILRRSLLLTFEPVRLEVSVLRARAALSLARDPKCENREALIQEAQRMLRVFDGLDAPTVRWVVLSIQIGLAAVRDQQDEVKRLLGHLAKDDSEEAWAARQLACWVLGAMRGGIEGDAQVRASQEALAARGIAPDRRLLLVQFTGLGEVSPSAAGS